MSSEPEHLLCSVATITEHRQLESLARSLIDTIRHTMGIQDIAIVNVGALPHLPKMIASSDVIPSLIALPPCVQACVEHSEVILCHQSGPSSVALPIKVNDIVVKVLLIYDFEPDKTELTMLIAFSRIYENFSHVIQESQMDSLTGLLNRKAYHARLVDLFTRVQSDIRTASHYWLMVFDIDFFKKINDTLGHLYGDEVLIRVSNMMHRCFRSDDALFRFGGDEFVVLLNNKSQFEVEEVCCQLLQMCKAIGHQKLGEVTLSLGVAALNIEDDPASIMTKADKALYFVKQNGRNGWAIYDDLVLNGSTTPTQIIDDIELF